MGGKNAPKREMRQKRGGVGLGAVFNGVSSTGKNKAGSFAVRKIEGPEIR